MNLRILSSLLISVFCLFSVPAFAQDNVIVTGVVSSSEDGLPLPGAAVMADASNATVTDIDGRYSIQVPSGTVLTASCFGFVQMTFPVPAGVDKVSHDFSMQSEAQALDDVVVIAYGTRKKGTIAGSVTTVKSEKIANVPAASFDQALQGSTPGLTVLSNSGEPSASAVFSIRGTNSINSGTSPLFILDGMPISGSDFNALNPNDIESVSVLKDASSTSIYGARAANGVIVITTKRGRMDGSKARVTARAQLGFSNMASGKWNMMNTEERIAYEKEVGLTSGKDYETLSKIDYNWLEEVFRDNAFLQSYDLQVDGALNKVRYYVSGNFYDQEGISLDSDFRRYNVRANVEAQAKDWLKIGTNILLTHEKIRQSVSGDYNTVTPISASRFMMPYWSPYKKDGSYASLSDGTWLGLNQNPLEWMVNNPETNYKNKVIGSLFLEIAPVKGLTIRSQGGVDFSHIFSEAWSMPSYIPNNGQGTAAKSTSQAYNLTISNTINYNFDIENLHHLNFMVGQEGVNYKSSGFSVSTSGQNNDNLTNIASGTRARSWSDSSSSYSYVSFFGRGEYNYGSRYYADFSVRADASSRFGKDNRWAAFWSLGFMWDLRNESFMKDVHWLSNAQIAVSTGTSGNSSIPNYDHLDLVGGGPDYMGDSGIAPVSQGNENLTWETLWTTNLALHFGFLERIRLDVELYDKQTSNMLMAVPQSYANGGFGTYWDNVGAMVNRGVEMSLDVDVIRTRNFRWNVNANASYNKNKITELYNGVTEYVQSTTGMKLQVGHPYSEFYLNRYAGVNPVDGNPLWYDKDGNITSEYRESDKVMTGCTSEAPWQGGFGTALSWKGLSLSAQFSWVADRWMINNDRYFEENTLFDQYNQSKRMLYDRWKKPGDVTDIPKYGTTPQFDTHLLENASFLRLKNLTIAYSLPKSVLDRMKVFSAARVYAQGQNLLTFTGFSGLDPESNLNVYKAQYPMSRQFTFGLEITF
ncbi:MAG: SusC/RagA family TonB-linked outer membrane protein [Candidatus Cryptobacteroides sp.]